MSAYDTVDRIDSADVAVRVYCEVPMDPAFGVMLEAGAAAVFLNPEQAIRVATALLNAAARVQHGGEVDAVVAGRRRAPVTCSKCGHKFSGGTHDPDGKGCDVVVDGKRCGCMERAT
jgi:hypothetical protein